MPDSAEHIVATLKLQEILHKRSIDQLLDTMIDQPSLFKANWHPLGFVHVKLQGDTQSSLRLHIWPKGKRSTQNPAWLIHSHIFDIKSAILCGAMTNVEYQVSSDQEAATHRVYEVCYIENISQLHKTDELVRCSVNNATIYLAGQCYQMKLDVYHTSEVKDDTLTATIVKTTNHMQVKPRTLGDLNAEPVYIYDRTIMAQEI